MTPAAPPPLPPPPLGNSTRSSTEAGQRPVLGEVRAAGGGGGRSNTCFYFACGRTSCPAVTDNLKPLPDNLNKNSKLTFSPSSAQVRSVLAELGGWGRPPAALECQARKFEAARAADLKLSIIS